MTTTPLQARLRAALTEALGARDSAAVAAVRSALGAVANAEAVPSAKGSRVVGSTHVAGAVAGLGAAEARRRELTEQDVAGLVTVREQRRPLRVAQRA